MTENVTRAKTTENGKSPYAVTIEVSGHTLDGDEPVSFGGKNAGPAPYDLLTAALAECTAITIRLYAEQNNWPLEEVEITVDFQKKVIHGHRYPVDFFEKRIVLHGPDLTEAQRAKLLEVSAKSPLHRTLENTPIIKTV